MPGAQVRGVGGKAHALLAAGDDDGRVAGLDRLGGEGDGAQARAADLVDAPGGDLLRDAGGHRGLAGGVLALGGGQHLAENDFRDVLRRDPGLRQRRLDGDAAELVGGRGGEGAEEGAYGRALGGGDDDVGHESGLRGDRGWRAPSILLQRGKARRRAAPRAPACPCAPTTMPTWPSARSSRSPARGAVAWGTMRSVVETMLSSGIGERGGIDDLAADAPAARARCVVAEQHLEHLARGGAGHRRAVIGPVLEHHEGSCRLALERSEVLELGDGPRRDRGDQKALCSTSIGSTPSAATVGCAPAQSAPSCARDSAGKPLKCHGAARVATLRTGPSCAAASAIVPPRQ